MSAPLWRSSAGARYQAAVPHLGRTVRVAFSSLRDRSLNRTVEGRLISVASLLAGGSGDVLVLEPEDLTGDMAISLAAVDSITRC